ncbi:MAG: thermonuclease family protein [Cyanobacteria bacterium P01_D01_bin.6]
MWKWPSKAAVGKGIMGILEHRTWRRVLIGLSVVAIAMTLNLSAPAASAQLTATVDYAKSGNTLELLFELPNVLVSTIRLAAIEAPDREQVPWGPESQNCLANLRNQIIRLELVDEQPDAYNRLWAYGWLNRKLINSESLAAGCTYLADPTDQFSPYYQELLYAQEQARILGLGIWHPQNPLRETAKNFRERSYSP